MGPNTTIEITRTGLRILEQPKHVVWGIARKPGPGLKVRTNSMIIATRG